MANYKRKKSKRNVKCTICTTNRWKGNGKDRFKAKDTADKKHWEAEMKKTLKRAGQAKIYRME